MREGVVPGRGGADHRAERGAGRRRDGLRRQARLSGASRAAGRHVRHREPGVPRHLHAGDRVQGVRVQDALPHWRGGPLEHLRLPRRGRAVRQHAAGLGHHGPAQDHPAGARRADAARHPGEQLLPEPQNHGLLHPQLVHVLGVGPLHPLHGDVPVHHHLLDGRRGPPARREHQRAATHLGGHAEPGRGVEQGADQSVALRLFPVADRVHALHADEHHRRSRLADRRPTADRALPLLRPALLLLRPLRDLRHAERAQRRLPRPDHADHRQGPGDQRGGTAD
mmetsp:Transcript_41057/g.121739  ORF Transcript_41057/g.121739 Transcript_41057/m.121739 type:complete len:281 (-) Transcript_41057:261-1103(-)